MLEQESKANICIKYHYTAQHINIIHTEHCQGLLREAAKGLNHPPSNLHSGLIAQFGGEYCLSALTLDMDRWVCSPFSSSLSLSLSLSHSEIEAQHHYLSGSLQVDLLTKHISQPHPFFLHSFPIFFFWMCSVTGTNTAQMVKPVHVRLIVYSNSCTVNCWHCSI